MVDYAIIGNGLLGIHLARYLNSRNESYVILEKSRNIGGRFASRRFQDIRLDFGVRSFKWSEDFFQDEIKEGISQGLLRFENGVIYPVASFNDWTKSLAQDLNIKNFKVDEVSYTSGIYTLKSSEGTLKANNLLITAPAYQTYELVKDLGDYDHLNEVQYTKEIYYMFSSRNESFQNSELELIDSREINGTYYHRCRVNFWTEKSREEVKDYFDKTIKPIESFAHKWRYAQVLKHTMVNDQSDTLFCLGDYYSEGLKGSYESAALFKQKYS